MPRTTWRLCLLLAATALAGLDLPPAALAGPSSAPGSAQAPAADVSAILAANEAATAGAASPAGLRIDYAFDGMGLKGVASSVVDLRDGRYVDSLEAGPLKQAQGFDGQHAWQQDSSGAVTAQDSPQPLALARNEAYRRANLWWKADRAGAIVQALGRREADGAVFDVISVIPNGGLPFEAWFDAAHHLARVVEKQGAAVITTTYSDYRPAAGRMIPWRTAVDDGEGAKYVITETVTAVAAAEPAAQAFAAPKTTLADFALDGGARETTIPIELVNNHIYGRAMVNGKGPFRFIFDTGGTELLTPATAKAIGLNVQGEFDAHGAGEGIMQAGFAKVEELQVGGARVKGLTFAVLPLDALSDVEGVDQQGMVGFQTARRFVTRIDYGARTLTLIDPKAFDPKDAGTPVPFHFADNDVEIAGTFEGLPGKFRIDTGARDEITLNRPFAERIAFRKTHPRGVETVDGWGVGGPSIAYVARAASLKIGRVDAGPVVAGASVATKGAFGGDDNQGNIGAGVLKRFVVTFDYPHQVMYLKPAAGPVADTNVFDRSGLWIHRAPEGMKVINVTAHSAAEAAGVQAGDIIRAVDGRPAREIAVWALRQRLRDEAPGTPVDLTLVRDGKPLEARLVLRDQI